jgi:hypothetical protein
MEREDLFRITTTDGDFDAASNTRLDGSLVDVGRSAAQRPIYKRPIYIGEVSMGSETSMCSSHKAK